MSNTTQDPVAPYRVVAVNEESETIAPEVNLEMARILFYRWRRATEFRGCSLELQEWVPDQGAWVTLQMFAEEKSFSG